MKLNELDKTKLPIKVVSDATGAIFRVTFMDDEYALAYSSHNKPCAFRIDDDCWFPYQEPKQKVAKYVYKFRADNKWYETSEYCVDDEDFKKKQ